MSWVCPRASFQWDMSGNVEKCGDRSARDSTLGGHQTLQPTPTAPVGLQKGGTMSTLQADRSNNVKHLKGQEKTHTSKQMLKYFLNSCKLIIYTNQATTHAV